MPDLGVSTFLLFYDITCFKAGRELPGVRLILINSSSILRAARQSLAICHSGMSIL